MNKLELFNAELNRCEEDLEDISWSDPMIYKNGKLSIEFLRMFKRDISWEDACFWQALTTDEIDEFSYYIDWYWVSRNRNLSNKHIEQHLPNMNIEGLIETVHLSEDIITLIFEKYPMYIDSICAFQYLSESFIEKFDSLLPWTFISKYQKLSNEFISKHADKVDWKEISGSQQLSEDFIHEHKDLVSWDIIVKAQLLSEAFIREHIKHINLDILVNYKKLSDNFIKEYNLTVNKDSWLYRSKEWKKNYMLANTKDKYELHDDYFIGYKGIRSDRHSIFNFQFKYEKGCVYETQADASNRLCSFGINVASLSNATSYAKDKLIRCKVYYNDIACVNDNGYVRAYKITVLD